MALPLISRRQALLALAAAAPACHSRAEPQKAANEPENSAAEALQFATGGDLGEKDRGGTTVVLLHGFGASADDLIALARDLARPKTRYIVPAGPIELPNGGRAWWPMHGRATYDANQVLKAPAEKVTSARLAVQKLLSTLHEQLAPDALFLLGFSQGAMLALDVVLAASSVDRVAVLSGALLDETVERIAMPRSRAPAVFVSHGRKDPVLRFQGAERLVETLKSSHFSVDFRPFEGGHEITAQTTADLRAFLFDSAG